MNPLLTYQDVATRWGKSVRAIEDMKRARRIDHIKIGRSVRFEESAVSAVERVFKAKGIIR